MLIAKVNAPAGIYQYTNDDIEGEVKVTAALPQIDAVTWNTRGLTLASNAGAITTLRKLLGEMVPLGQPKVAHFYFRAAEDPSTLVEVPDEALRLENTYIIIDAAPLLSSAGFDRIRFVRGDGIEVSFSSGDISDQQDQMDDTFLDYPGVVVDDIELVPLQPIDGVLICDLPAPSLANLVTVNFQDWAVSEGMIDQGDGWYMASRANHDLDSNAGQIDVSGLTGGGLNSATFVVDIGRPLGPDDGDRTTINFRDYLNFSHQRLRVNDLLGAARVTPLGNTPPTDFGVIPCPDGGWRVWAHVGVSADGRVEAYLNSANTGGVFGFVGVYDGALTVEQIAGI